MYSILIYDLQAQDWHIVKLVNNSQEAKEVSKEWEDNGFITTIEIN